MLNHVRELLEYLFILHHCMSTDADDSYLYKYILYTHDVFHIEYSFFHFSSSNEGIVFITAQSL